MDMKKILQAIDNASTEVSSSEMQRLRNIVEGKGPLNRLTAAESMTVDHYSALRTTITSPVLNVQEDTRPSMIGKYFKTVEEELQESAQQGNLRTRQLAERVTTRLNELSTATLASYKKKAGADASKADKEGDFKRGDKRFSGIVKATKKQFANDTKQGVAEEEEDKIDSRFKKTEWMPLMDAIKILKHYGATPEKYMGHEMFPYYDIEGNRKYLEDITWNADNSKNVRVSLVNQAVRELKTQQQSLAEGNDPNELTASVTVDGEFKEFDLTPFIAKNNWVGTPQQVIKLAEKWLSDFLRKKGLAYSNLKITYKGMTLNANQIGDVGSSEFESVAEGERTMSRANYNEAANAAQQAAIAIAKKKAGKK